MHLREPGLLLVIIGVPQGSLQSVLRGGLDVYVRAVSSEGLLSVRKYWDAHCAVFTKLPALALLHPGACPRGLTPADFVALLSRLSDLRPWQIWELWEALDVRRCGLLGCPEFTLLVVLLCAGLAQQQLRAVHVYAHSISRVFTGAHVVNTCAGLGQCCQLLGLSKADMLTALQQLQLLPGTASRSAAKQVGCCSSSSSSSQQEQQQQQHISRRESSDALPSQPAAAGGMPGGPRQQLACCCQSGAGGSKQWACGAAAHRSHCAAKQGLMQDQQQQQWSHSHSGAWLSVQGVKLVLYQTISSHARRQGSVCDHGSTSRPVAPAAGCCVVC